MRGGLERESEWLTCPECPSDDVVSIHVQDDCFPRVECQSCGATSELGT